MHNANEISSKVKFQLKERVGSLSEIFQFYISVKKQVRIPNIVTQESKRRFCVKKLLKHLTNLLFLKYNIFLQGF